MGSNERYAVAVAMPAKQTASAQALQFRVLPVYAKTRFDWKSMALIGDSREACRATEIDTVGGAIPGNCRQRVVSATTCARTLQKSWCNGLFGSLRLRW